MSYETYDSGTQKCACARHVGDLDLEHHERLLGIEGEGADGLAYLVELVVSQVDEGAADGELRVGELPNFVSLHNWQNAEAMTRLGRMLEYMGVLAAEARDARDSSCESGSEPTDEIQEWLDKHGAQ